MASPAGVAGTAPLSRSPAAPRGAARRLPWLLTLAVLTGTATVVGVALWRDVDGAVSFVDVPLHVGTIAALHVGTMAAMAPAVGAPPAAEPAIPAPEPVPAAATLRPAPDGRAAAAACDRPCVALVVVGLGQLPGPTSAAIDLPSGVTLSFSPYADDLAGTLARAREDGHEVLLGLPLQPARYPYDDAGPLMLRPEEPAEAQAAALRRILDLGGPLAGVTLEAGAFAGNGEATVPIVDVLGQRSLALVELGGRHLQPAAEAAGVPYLSAVGPIDAAASAVAVEAALDAVEALARRDGTAIAFARPIPVGIQTLAAWVEGLPDKGLTLAPLPALLATAAGEPAGAASRASLRSSLAGAAQERQEAATP